MLTLANPRDGLVILILIMLFAFCIFGVCQAVTVALPEIIPNAIPGHPEHSEAQEIRDCKNVAEIWLNKTCQRFTIVKELEQGRYGGQVVQPCKRGLLEVTAYIFASAGKPLDLKMVERILMAKGCSPVAK